MKFEQFCYWLQGAFELSDVTIITQNQAKIIRDHIEMVKIHDPKSLDEGFGKWILDVMTFTSFVSGNIGKEGTEEIRKRLGEQFLHELDRRFTQSQQAQLNNAHNNRPVFGHIMRC